MANTSEILAALDAAIEKAHGLNQEAGAALEQAIQKARNSIECQDSDQYRYAHRMLGVYIKAHNVAAGYFLRRMKKQKAAARRG